MVGFINFSTNAAWIANSGMAGFGWTFELIFSPILEHSGSDLYVSSALEVEALAMILTILYASDLQYKSVIFNSDS